MRRWMTQERMAGDLEVVPTALGGMGIAAGLNVMVRVIIAMRMGAWAAIAVVGVAGSRAAPLTPLPALSALTSVLLVTRQSSGWGGSTGPNASHRGHGALDGPPPPALSADSPVMAGGKAGSLATAPAFSVARPALPALRRLPVRQCWRPCRRRGQRRRTCFPWCVPAWSSVAPRRCAHEWGRPQGRCASACGR